MSGLMRLELLYKKAGSTVSAIFDERFRKDLAVVQGVLFRKLVDLLQFYADFEVNVLKRHCNFIHSFQLLAFNQEPKLMLATDTWADREGEFVPVQSLDLMLSRLVLRDLGDPAKLNMDQTYFGLSHWVGFQLRMEGYVSVAVPGGSSKAFRVDSCKESVLSRLERLYGVGDLLDAEGFPLIEERLHAGSYVYAIQGPEHVVAELCRIYADRLREARDVSLERNPLREDDRLPMDGLGDLQIPRDDPGLCFPIVGRHETLCSLVYGAVLAFRNFTRANTCSASVDAGLRDPHFNALIAYPGAGKSTIGRDFPALFRKFWTSGDAIEFLKSRKLLVNRDFIQMVQDSLGYNASLYHNIHDHQGGLLYPVERKLASSKSFEQILALRLLFAAVSKPVPTLSYESMLHSIAHIATRITLNDVLIFFRKAVETSPSHQRPILVSLFLDEINCAEYLGNTSWLQEVLSSYVYSFQASRETNVLLVVTASDKAASFRLGRTPHIPIPVSALKAEDAVTVVTNFFSRLSVTLGRSEKFCPSNILKLCISLIGGMPRHLGYMIRGMLTSDPSERICAATLLQTAQEFTTDILMATLKNTISLTSWSIGKYEHGTGFAILLTALRHSLLGTVIYRSDPVVDSNDIRVIQFEENSWGALEQKGLISLQLVDSNASLEPDQWRCRVHFPPLLALAMQSSGNDYFVTCFTSATERRFRGRELSDLQFIAFMIFLLKSPLVEEGSPRVFRLRDIIPCVWDIHRDLESLVLPYPDEGRLTPYRTMDQVTGAALQALVLRRGPRFSLLASGNSGLDSVHVLDNFLIITQTRSSDDAKEEPQSDAATIFWSCLSDLTGVARLEHLTTADLEEFGPVPTDLRQEVQQLCDNIDLDEFGPAPTDLQQEVLSRKRLRDNIPSSPAPSSGPSRLTRSKRASKLRYDNFVGMHEEVDYPTQSAGCYDLSNIVYIYSSDHYIEQSERSKIMNSQNPLCRRIVIRQADSAGVLDMLSEVRHLSPLLVV
ncbi:uncharacterized protein LOC9654739 [Selaginella moellendorffii]|uniref:uncharacterized protein LOC9654739 n=1 Tax=Selaginella moellendorffii TaxID=88036 RepID=UPI000D1CEE83|nr:uncharacterized protein LOC9654739 [Selaginella moellendorffii]|eukprot:XP_024544003.1 uncharacterized protein LOC9654739 [Selaginella moellendorffii]